MEAIFSIIKYTHIVAGSLSLVLFWIPALTKKGGKTHLVIGRWYVRMMWAVVATAGLMSVYNLSQGHTNKALFLGFLALLTGVPLWYGVVILKCKKVISTRYMIVHMTLNSLLFVSGAALAVYGLYFSGPQTHILMVIFGGIGLIGFKEIRRGRKMFATQNSQWFRQHFKGMIISGLAAHTAFLAFGGQQWMSQFIPKNGQVMLWVSPTIIGLIAIRLLVKHYRKKGVVE